MESLSNEPQNEYFQTGQDIAVIASLAVESIDVADVSVADSAAVDTADEVTKPSRFGLLGRLSAKVGAGTGEVLKSAGSVTGSLGAAAGQAIDSALESAKVAENVAGVARGVGDIGQKTRSKLGDTVSSVKDHAFVQSGLEIAGKATPWVSVLWGYASDATLSFKDMPSDWQRTFASRMSNHGINPEQAFDLAPDALRRMNQDAIADWFDQKDWSHEQSQHNRPDLASDINNAIWEDSSVNRARGKADMSLGEKMMAHADNRWDVLKTRAFWGNALKGAVSAAAIAVIITFVDRVLVERDRLINSSPEERLSLITSIAKETGFAGLQSGVVCFVLIVLSATVPGMAAVLGVVSGPLAIIGSLMMSGKFIHSLLNHPSEQEQRFFADMKAKVLGLTSQETYIQLELAFPAP